MSDEDRAQAHRHAFARHSNEAVSAAALWCRAADIPPQEKAEAVRRLIVRLQDVVRVEVTW